MDVRSGREGLPPQVDAVLFDMDGTLVDSEGAWYAAAEEMWGEGLDASSREDFLGATMDEVIDSYLRHHPDEDRSAALQRAMDLVESRLAAGVSTMPGAAALLERLAGRVPLAVASNSPRRFVTRVVEGQGWADVLTVALGLDDVDHGKPAPDLYLAAARALGVRPGRCVVVEDSPAGVEAGHRAGAFVLAVGSDVVGRGDLHIDSLADAEVTQWEPSPWEDRQDGAGISSTR